MTTTPILGLAFQPKRIHVAQNYWVDLDSLYLNAGRVRSLIDEIPLRPPQATVPIEPNPGPYPPISGLWHWEIAVYGSTNLELSPGIYIVSNPNSQATGRDVVVRINKDVDKKKLPLSAGTGAYVFVSDDLTWSIVR